MRKKKNWETNDTITFENNSRTDVFTAVCNNFRWKYVLIIARYPDCQADGSALHFTPITDLFFPTPTWLLWEAFSHNAITAQILFTHISTPFYSQVLIYNLCEGHHEYNENA